MRLFLVDVWNRYTYIVVNISARALVGGFHE